MSTDTARDPQPRSMQPVEEVTEPYDVTQLHAQIMREKEEPRDGFEPVPIWMTALFGALLFWGGYYMSSYSGYFSATVQDGVDLASARPRLKEERIPDTPEGLYAMGQKLYRNCQVCHQPDGNGNQQYPPLAGSDWVVGDEASQARLSRILLYGINGPLEVNQTTYNGQMPAWGGQLKDYQIAAVLTYIRQEWGNQGSAVFPETVSAARQTVGNRGPLSQAELKAIPVDQVDPGAAEPMQRPGNENAPKEG